MGTNGVVTTPPATRARVAQAEPIARKIVHWSEEELAVVASAYWNLRESNPELSDRMLIRIAQQNMLDESRWRAVAHYSGKTVATLLAEISRYKPDHTTLPEPEPEPVKSSRKVRVCWNADERSAMVAAGIEVASSEEKLNLKVHISKAMQLALPPDRWRAITNTSRRIFGWFHDGVRAGVEARRVQAELEALRSQVETPKEEPPAPPPPAPLPAPTPVLSPPPLAAYPWDFYSESVVFAAPFSRSPAPSPKVTEEPVTREPVSTEGVWDAIDSIHNTLRDLGSQFSFSQALLRRIAEDLDPNALRSVEAQIASPATQSLPFAVPPRSTVENPVTKKSPPKLRVLLVGYLGNQEQTIQQYAKEYASLEFVPTGREACARGFTGKDLVILARHNGHMVYDAAKKAVGADNVVFQRSTSAHATVQLIREKSASLQRQWAKAHA